MCDMPRSAANQRLPPPSTRPSREPRREYRAPSSADPDFDPITLIASAMDVREQILEAAMAGLGDASTGHRPGSRRCYRDRGFLSLDIGEIAIETGASHQDIEQVLQTIQEIAPPGVGARSLQESLSPGRLSAGARRRRSPDREVRHRKPPGRARSKRIARIARALGVDLEESKPPSHSFAISSRPIPCSPTDRSRGPRRPAAAMSCPTWW